MPFVSINPTTGEEFGRYENATPDQLKEHLALGQSAFESWKETSIAERAALMKKLAQYFRGHAKELGEIMTKEMGKPIKQAISEAEKCAWVCDYYADHTEEILQKEVIESAASNSYVRFDPIGIILAVMPWNYPLWQVMRFAAPAAMAGNVGILKHASNVPECAMAIEKAFLEVGFPKGIFQAPMISSRDVEMLLEDDRVMAATLTGSEYAGSQVAMNAGKNLKKTVLELGGSDPFIVLADTDMDHTCGVAVNARLHNAGQTCISAKRYIVVDEIADDFVKRIKEGYETTIVGDPMDEATEMGPLSSEGIMKEVHEQVEKAIEQGATLLTGGKRIGDKGNFYAPTILDHVKKGNIAYDEEIFGPVATVIRVKDENEAVQVANDNRFGLGASIWTQDIAKAEEIARRVEAGAVFINGMVISDPRLPFGGVKKSGYGRELSHYGIKEFMNIKTIWIK